MRVLFVHSNFPGQFLRLAQALKARGDEVRALAAAGGRPEADIPITRFTPPPVTDQANPVTARFETDIGRATAALHVAQAMNAEGYAPDLIIGHPVFGEMTFLTQVWPNARVIAYAENYIDNLSSTLDFDPMFPPIEEWQRQRTDIRHAGAALTWMRADALVSPTEFQRNTFPKQLRKAITLIPDGVDTDEVRPRSGVSIATASGEIIAKPGDEVITYVNRYLEPLRGIHIFLRALQTTLQERPNARVLIVGAPHTRTYGRAPPPGKTWLQIFVDEAQGKLDPARIHLLGRVDRASYLSVLAVSTAHVYLTYPYVLSWSALEAMSAGCLLIGSKTAPVEEFVEHGRNGLLVDFFDHAALAQTLTEALANPTAYAPLRTQARADAVARYDLNTMALPRWLSLIDAVAAQGR